MTSIARYTGTYVAAATFVTSGAIVTGIVVAARDGGTAVFASVTWKKVES